MCRSMTPAVLIWGPTWRGIWGHPAHRVLQCGQPGLHVADALSEAGLLALQQLLQLADGSEDLLLAETVLWTKDSATHRAWLRPALMPWDSRTTGSKPP